MNKENTLYLIVYKEVINRIFSGEKTIEYRECTKYWKKELKINNIDLCELPMVMEMPQDLIS